MYDWKKEFEPQILRRGRGYFTDGKITDIKETSDGFQACVKGSEAYTVHIVPGKRYIRKMTCTCPYAAENDNLCKHMASVLYYLTNRGKLHLIKGEAAIEAEALEILKERVTDEGLMTHEQFEDAIEKWKTAYHAEIREEHLDPDAFYCDAGQEEEADEEAGEDIEEKNPDAEDEKTLEELLEELDSLAGLEAVKKDIRSMINFIRINQLRQQRGLKKAELSLHLVFSGNPGTGKTTVARLLARLYHKIGILPQGQLVEVDRSALVGGYLGQTAIKTAEVIQSALGGVLFIDEAYSLVEDEQDSYGRECISTILKAMEDHREELVVIVAGYEGLMHKFIDSNPGLRSRFNKYFHFPDYTGEEMESIFLLLCKSNGYKIEPATQKLVRAYFDELYENRDENFGNGRSVRNFFEKMINAQASRLAEDPDITNEELEMLTAEDMKI